jgi:hypothetical protein
MWEPHIGSGFADRRLLLLGESCYDWKEDDSCWTTPAIDHPCTMIKWEAEGSHDVSFSRSMSRGLCHEYAPSHEAKQAMWKTVAFTNYVPGTVGFGAGVRPSAAQWRQAEKEWPDLLDRIMPTKVVVIGKVMWGRLPFNDVLPDNPENVAIYRRSDGVLVTCRRIKHLSRGGSWKALMAAIQASETS